MPQLESTPDSLKTTQHGGRHYKDMAIQPAEYNHRNNLPFCAAEAIKYLSRYRSKNGAEDVRKAIHFAQMILDMDYGIKTEVTYIDPSQPACPSDPSDPSGDKSQPPPRKILAGS